MKLGKMCVSCCLESCTGGKRQKVHKVLDDDGLPFKFVVCGPSIFFLGAAAMRLNASPGQTQYVRELFDKAVKLTDDLEALGKRV